MLTIKDEQFPVRITLDATNSEARSLTGDVLDQPLTTTQRTIVRSEREDEWEAFCDGASKIPGMRELQDRVAAHFRKELGL